MLLNPHHAGLGAEPLDTSYGIFEGAERLRVATLDLVSAETAVVQRLLGLISSASLGGIETAKLSL